MAKIIYLAEMITQPEAKDPIIPPEFLEQLELKIENLEELRAEFWKNRCHHIFARIKTTIVTILLKN